MQSGFYKEWKTTLAGILVAGVGFARYKGYIDQDIAALSITLIAGVGFAVAADSKKNTP